MLAWDALLFFLASISSVVLYTVMVTKYKLVKIVKNPPFLVRE